MVNKFLSRILPVFQIYTKFFEFLTKKPNFNSFLSILILNFLIISIVNFNDLGLVLRLIDANITSLIMVFCVLNLVFMTLFLISEKLAEFMLKILLCINIFTFIFELFTLMKFHSPFSIFILDAIMHTNKSETIEFIQTFFDLKFLFLSIAIILFIIFLQKLKSPNFSKKSMMIFLFIFIISTIIFTNKSIKNSEFNTKQLEKLSFFRFSFSINEYFTDKNPLNGVKMAELNYQKHFELNKNIIAKNRERERE